MTFTDSDLQLQDLFGIGAAEKYQQYICPECNGILKDAVKTNCGHFLCEDCVGLKYYEADIYKGQACCPVKECGKKLLGEDGTKYFPDNYVRRQIAHLPTTCPISGCQWKGLYKDYLKGHHDKEHPPALLETVPKRKATHALVKIQIFTSTPQILREEARQLIQSADNLLQQADSMEQVSNRTEYIERVSADSLKKSQTGASASSNKSLKHAEDLKAFVEARSHTLDAHTANEQVHLETAPEAEHTVTNTLVSHQQGQLVTGTTSISQHPSNTDEAQPFSTLNPPALQYSLSSNLQQTTAHQIVDASASDLAKAQSVFPRSHQRKKPPSLDLQPSTTIKNPIQATSALSQRPSKSPIPSPCQPSPLSPRVPTLSPHQSSFPTNPLQPCSPNIPQTPPPNIQTLPSNVLYKPPPSSVPPPPILRVKNPPALTSSVASPKSKSSPQRSECSSCKTLKKTNKALTVALGALLGVGHTGCSNCAKEDKPTGRRRFRSFS